MLKCILFLLTEYYYNIVKEHIEEIRDKVYVHQVDVLLDGCRIEGMTDGKNINAEETLVITDDPQTAEQLLNDGKYVLILYHEKNKNQNFPSARYAIEDLFSLEYSSYEQVFKRLAGLPLDILETKRIRVRESTLEDVDEFYRIYCNPAITYYMEDLFQDKEAELAYMKSYIDQIYGFYGYGLWTVLAKETGQVIGRAGLSVREGYELPELGYVIDVHYQKQGYAYEVCEAILQYAREELEFDKVQALIDERNVASLRLIEKLGFIFERNVTERGLTYRLYTKML